MVFLRPVVVRDTQQSDSLSLDRYDLMRLRQELAQPVPSKMVPVNEAPVLPRCLHAGRRFHACASATGPARHALPPA
jgi:general secretion pathway protein D